MPANSSEFDSNQGSREPFSLFLKSLCAEDPDEANRRYLRLHRKLEGYFRLRGMIDPIHDADDTIDRAAKRIANGISVPEVDKFCIGIARNIVKERFRQKKHEDDAFTHFQEENQSDNEELIEQITNLMRRCFDRLPQDDRNVLHSYCKVPEGISRPEHRRQLAEKLQSTIEALRIRVTRLRRRLDECVKALRKKL